MKKTNLVKAGLLGLAIITGANAGNTVMTGIRGDIENGGARQETVVTIDNGKIWAKATNPIGSDISDRANSDVMMLVGSKHKAGLRTNLDGTGVAIAGLAIGPNVADKVQTYAIGLKFDGMGVAVGGLALHSTGTFLDGLEVETAAVIAGGAVQDVSTEIIHGVNVNERVRLQGSAVIGKNGLRSIAAGVQLSF